MTNNLDLQMMSLAIDEAKKAKRLGEVPIGAVIAQNGQVIATGHNLRETGRHALAHAEIIALDAACKTLGGWRLPNCTLYVTLEPCPMCAGAIINSRIARVVFGAYDSKAGSFGSLVDLSKVAYNHAPQLCGGVMETECAALLRDFFRNLRQR
ncbi:MAG: nucleoside deaminase [Candidatus Fimivivens sp.]|nr:nucleoside deaminase [Candidatus Fimivivens sp.]